MEESLKITLFIDKRPEGIIQPNKTYGTQNYSDFYITVPLYKTSKLIDYINIYKDTFKTQINRQLINPYFIELDFFKTITNIDNSDKTGISGKTSMFGIKINNS